MYALTAAKTLAIRWLRKQQDALDFGHMRRSRSRSLNEKEPTTLCDFNALALKSALDSFRWIASLPSESRFFGMANRKRKVLL